MCNTITEQDKQNYWTVVKACLDEFHTGFYNETEADDVIEHLKEIGNQDPAGEIVYHEEPFYMACRLVNRLLPVSAFREDYEKILGKYQYDAS